MEYVFEAKNCLWSITVITWLSCVGHLGRDCTISIEMHGDLRTT